MDVDFEPNDVANTCSKESRRQFWISFSIFFFICAIIYVCAGIIYTLYTMNAEMEEELERQNIKFLAIYDSCKNIIFNIKEVDSNPTNTTLRIQWSDVLLIPSNIYVMGTNHWSTLSNGDVVLQSQKCHSVSVLWMPRFIDTMTNTL